VRHYGRSLAAQSLFGQHPHRIFQPFEGERVHALLHQLLHHADALAVLPDALGFGVNLVSLREAVMRKIKKYKL